jgi:hypothetical protein
MKRLLGIAVTGATLLSLLAVPAIAGKPMQMVDGMVAAPAPFTDDTGCYAGVHRRAQAVAQGQANGAIGYDWDVDKATWNKPFKLDVTGGQGTVDLDIYFYQGPRTTVQDFVDQQGDPVAPPTISYNTRKAGGEADKVPAGTTYAIVCMYAGAQGYTGAGASFHYMAGAGVK